MKFSMHFTNKIFILWCFIFLFWHYFDIFLSSHFSFILCDKRSVVISKVHYESTIFLEIIQKIYDDSH
jgi:hypothetical protein